MKKVTFYSYKGGSGRSFTLAYMAMRLAEKGKRVCVLDFDLEAPGLSYKFPDVDQEKKGIAEYLRANGNVSIDELKSDYAQSITVDGKSDFLYLVSAGQRFGKSSYFTYVVKEIGEMVATNKNGTEIIKKLVCEIGKAISPDYLFIDARSGVTPLGVFFGALIKPDAVMMFISNNDEGREGSKFIYDSIRNYKKKENIEIPIICAISRVTLPDELKDDEVNHIDSMSIAKFQEILGLADSTESSTVEIIHSDREIERDEASVLRSNGLPYDLGRVVIRDFESLLQKLERVISVSKDTDVELKTKLLFRKEEGNGEISNEVTPLPNADVQVYDFPSTYHLNKMPIKIWLRCNEDYSIAHDDYSIIQQIETYYKKSKLPSLTSDIFRILKHFCISKESIGIENQTEFKHMLKVSTRRQDVSSLAANGAVAKLYKCISFLNNLDVLGKRQPSDSESGRSTFVSRLVDDTENANVKPRPDYVSGFSDRYHKTNEQYKFDLIVQGNHYYISDKGKTNEMMSATYDIKSDDFVSVFRVLKQRLSVEEIGDELRVKVKVMGGGSPSKESIRKAEYKLYDLIVFVDNMHIFFI